MSKQQPYTYKNYEQQFQNESHNKGVEHKCVDYIKKAICCRWWKSGQNNIITTSKKSINPVSDNKLSVNNRGRLITEQSNDKKGCDKQQQVWRENYYKTENQSNYKNSFSYLNNKIKNNTNTNKHTVPYRHQQQLNNNTKNIYNNTQNDQINKQKTKRLMGITNLNNTCYMNATLQCLMNLEQFNNDLQKHEQKYLQIQRIIRQQQQKQTRQQNYHKQQSKQQHQPLNNALNTTREYLRVLNRCYHDDYYYQEEKAVVFESSKQHKKPHKKQFQQLLNIYDLRQAFVSAIKNNNNYDNDGEGISYNRFHQYKQQDAHQFVTCLLGVINKEVQATPLISTSTQKSYMKTIKSQQQQYQHQQYQYHQYKHPTNPPLSTSPPPQSLVNKHFQLKTLSTIQCKSCEHKQSVVDKLLGLSVDVNLTNKLDLNLNNSLGLYNDFGQFNGVSQFGQFNQFKQFSHNSQLSTQQQRQHKTPSIMQLIQNQWNPNNKCVQINNYFCDSCNQQTIIKKTQFLYQLPKVLMIQLKRFIQKQGYYHATVEKDYSQVQMSQFLDFGHLINRQSQGKDRDKDQQWLYKLTGVVHHYGSTKSGHYTAHVHKQNLNQWFLLNDSIVEKINFRALSKSAYLLFYQRVQKND